MQYTQITCKTALNHIKSKTPYEWDLNIYRGCAHRCQYCFALYSHRYMESDQFFDEIFVKTNIVQRLEEKLSSRRWEHEVINIGGVTDSYQPIEQQAKLMPEILKLMIKYKNPVMLSTKSDLILRDYDFIDQLSRITSVNIASTVTTVDELVREKLEPGAVSSGRRLAMLKEFRKTNASVGLHMMPALPYLTDSYEALDALYSAAKEADVHYLLPGTLNLRGKTRQVYFQFLRREYPHILPATQRLFRTGSLDKDYRRLFYQNIASLTKKYGLDANYKKVMQQKLVGKQEVEQLSFFL